MLLDHLKIDIEAQTRAGGHLDIAVLDDLLGLAVDGDKVTPERLFGVVVLKRNEVLIALESHS